MRGALIPLAAATALVAGCLRYQTVWSGAAYIESGQIIALAADEPLCGCLILKNFSDRDIMLRSVLQGNELGSQLLPKATTLRVRFDWAGPNGSDLYHLEGWDAGGRQVRLQDVTTIEDNGWPWQVCSADPACPGGTLSMNMAEIGRE